MKTISGFAFKSDETPQSFYVVGRSENPSHPGAVLSPTPISASIPLSRDFSAWKQPKMRPFQTVKKAPKLEFESLGNQFPHLIGGHFTPYMFTLRTGEDISRRVLSFSQEEDHGICVLSATGSISEVTLRQPGSYNDLAYEGFFNIASLTGSFMPAHDGLIRSRCGGMSISLVASDGTIFGGVIVGPLIAATPVQLLVWSFPPRPALEFHLIRQRTEEVSPVTAIGGFAVQELNLGSLTPDLNEDPRDPAGDEDMRDSDGGSDNDIDEDEDEAVEDNPSEKNLGTSG